ncbi:hypothetical protein IAE35_00320 [Pseudomonas sp. S75]|uniref:hypothetical protein n=1 Tax=unclassified Pseudomonas TaxID=196821 RepID=UPI001902C8FD|nr:MULTISPECIES: hypothetical protein [unclassified Pseudomonas]MBJ9974289.1 hypothetical protein [Pseudomonas sp. S30]MBK0151781.1 hypothetical protein [Pseudomonas sp. S75]
MNKTVALLFCAMLLPGIAMAEEDRHKCEAALDKLKDATEASFTKSGHHEHQQAKAAHESGDYEKCVHQAEKAASHQKQG